MADKKSLAYDEITTLFKKNESTFVQSLKDAKTLSDQVQQATGDEVTVSTDSLKSVLNALLGMYKTITNPEGALRSDHGDRGSNCDYGPIWNVGDIFD